MYKIPKIVITSLPENKKYELFFLFFLKKKKLYNTLFKLLIELKNAFTIQ